ncbi:unnamed protein product [Arabis nemorensis]|uniref:Uncharacterized protein n=1 Tax=Arabis nemorensis TaxID=586526 RepID=A0A565B9J4_9BRAS|nr:unnamed protein product [Arabis nemorensis]
MDLPGRANLPLLSEVPIKGKDPVWFTQDKGLLTRVIAEIFRRKFDGPYFSWTVTPIDKQKRYFRTFAGMYNWDKGITPLEEELGRFISFDEVFRKTHTKANGSFVDEKAKQVAETYDRTLQEVLDQPEGGPEASDASEHSTQRTLSIDEKNEIFLKCTEIDSKGNPYGMGQLSQVHKGKRKRSYGESSTSSLLEIQHELKAARQKIAEYDEENQRSDEENRRRDAENQRRDEELRQSQVRIDELEKLFVFMKNNNSNFAAYVSDSSVPATTTPQVEDNP